MKISYDEARLFWSGAGAVCGLAQQASIELEPLLESVPPVNGEERQKNEETTTRVEVEVNGQQTRFYVC